jgi:hypothetical protein
MASVIACRSLLHRVATCRLFEGGRDAGCGFISTDMRIPPGSQWERSWLSESGTTVQISISGLPQCSEEAEHLSAIVLPVLNL